VFRVFCPGWARLREGFCEPLVVRDEEFFFGLTERTWDDYFDFQPFARQYLREVLGIGESP
jgi:hypothetical protein